MDSSLCVYVICVCVYMLCVCVCVCVYVICVCVYVICVCVYVIYMCVCVCVCVCVSRTLAPSTHTNTRITRSTGLPDMYTAGPGGGEQAAGRPLVVVKIGRTIGWGLMETALNI